MLKGFKYAVAVAAVSFVASVGAAEAASLSVGTKTADTVLNWRLTGPNQFVDVNVSPFGGATVLDTDGDQIQFTGANVTFNSSVSGAGGFTYDTAGDLVSGPADWGPDAGDGGPVAAPLASHTDGDTFLDRHGLTIDPGVTGQNVSLVFTAGTSQFFDAATISVFGGPDGVTLLGTSTSLIKLSLGAGNYFIEIFGDVNNTAARYTAGIVSTPIPPAFLLFLSGLVGMVAIGRRRRASGAAA